MSFIATTDEPKKREMITLEISGCKAVCPFCQKSFPVDGFEPEKSGFWGHYFSQKHKSVRPRSDEHTEAVKSAIRHARNVVRKATNAAIDAQELAAKQAKAMEALRLASNFSVSGEFLDEVIAEVHSLINMMEPYYSQCGAANSGIALIDRLNAIMRVKP